MLRTALAALPGLLVDLQVTVTRQAQTSRGPGGARTKAAEAPIAFDWDAADMDRAVRNTITTWARHVLEERFTPAPLPLAGLTCAACLHPSCDALRCRPALIRLRHPTHRLRPLCGWLAGQVDWLARRPEAAVFLDEITSIRPSPPGPSTTERTATPAPAPLWSSSPTWARAATASHHHRLLSDR